MSPRTPPVEAPRCPCEDCAWLARRATPPAPAAPPGTRDFVPVIEAMNEAIRCLRYPDAAADAGRVLRAGDALAEAASRLVQADRAGVRLTAAAPAPDVAGLEAILDDVHADTGLRECLRPYLTRAHALGAAQAAGEVAGLRTALADETRDHWHTLGALTEVYGYCASQAVEIDRLRARAEAAERALADAQAEFACAETGLELQAQAHAARADAATREVADLRARLAEVRQALAAGCQRIARERGWPPYGPACSACGGGTHAEPGVPCSLCQPGAKEGAG